MNGRRIVLAGAAGGIGAATAKEILARGARVALLDITIPDPDPFPGPHDTAGEPRYRWFRVDVSDGDEVAEVADQAMTWLGGVDALVHMAGIMRGQGVGLEDLDFETWDQVLRVNLYSAFLLTKAVLPPMQQQKRGVMVLTSSMGGVSKPSGSLAYGASKGGMHGFALTLAEKLRPHGIRVNEFCPDYVDTPLLRDSIREGLAAGGPQDAYDEVRRTAVSPDAVAKIVAFLASEEADHISGAIFTK